MNSINFLEKPNFPLSSDVLDFMQKAYLLLQQFAGFGGNRYILAGCTETDNSVSDGYIVVDGEVIPFIGGTKQSQIIVITETNPIVAFGERYEGYTRRTARFGTGSPMYNWADFPRINNLQELLSKFSQIQWSQINNKPTTFPPSSHTQDWNTVTEKPTTFPPSGHRQDYGTLDNVPAAFPPTAHNQDWNTVTGKPTTFPPSGHRHDWNTITGIPKIPTLIYHGFSDFKTDGLTTDYYTDPAFAVKFYRYESYCTTITINGSNLSPSKYIINLVSLLSEHILSFYMSRIYRMTVADKGREISAGVYVTIYHI